MTDKIDEKLIGADAAMNTGLNLMQSLGLTPVLFIGKAAGMDNMIASFNVKATNDMNEREQLENLRKFCEQRLKEIPA